MNKFISILILLCICNTVCFGIEFDSSIDADIRKKYNVQENELPPLPSSVPTASKQNTDIAPVSTIVKYNPTGKTYTIKDGTEVLLVSKTKISDWMKRGNRVVFNSQYGISTKEGTTIPAGTTFVGTITDSHSPQLTGNGGLIELKIDEIDYNGVPSPINTKLSLVQEKKVFHGDIKGQRSYWKNTSKAMSFGKKTFNKTHKCAKEVGSIPIVNLLACPIWLCGAVVYVVNIPVAPVISIFRKGGSISLPAGTRFKIKIIGENKING